MNYPEVGYSKFCDLWQQLTPYVLIMKPATDLCWTCQKNNGLIYRSANLPESEKSHLVKEQESHLRHVNTERKYYNDVCDESNKTASPVLNVVDFNVSREPCSLDGTIHYSYDYAQQLHFPCDPYQPGPIYFKTPRKCALFGVCCESFKRQVNFLIDENVSTGKGADSTISYVHYFFERHGLGESNVHLHADNCGAQNKNNAFIWYYSWRTILDLHKSVKYSFMVAGHTKFAPDWCFGLLKKSTQRTFISSLYDIAQAVQESSNVNVAELVGLHDGSLLINSYQWTAYLGQYFKKLPSIKKFHHFRFDSAQPGVVFCKEFDDTPEIAHNILREKNSLPPPDNLPDVLQPAGMTRERREYLFKEIREFCRPGTEDLVAPPIGDAV